MSSDFIVLRTHPSFSWFCSPLDPIPNPIFCDLYRSKHPRDKENVRKRRLVRVLLLVFLDHYCRIVEEVENREDCKGTSE